jgi:hypothetical protein
MKSRDIIGLRERSQINEELFGSRIIDQLRIPEHNQTPTCSAEVEGEYPGFGELQREATHA